MEITGKVLLTLPTQSFTSRKDGSPIVKNAFVVETGGQYPKKIMFSVLGAERFSGMGIVVGGSYNVSFDIDAREYQGKWYNDIQAWRAVRVDGAQQGQQMPPQQQIQAQQPIMAQAPTVAQQQAVHVESPDLPF